MCFICNDGLDLKILYVILIFIKWIKVLILKFKCMLKEMKIVIF